MCPYNDNSLCIPARSHNSPHDTDNVRVPNTQQNKILESNENSSLSNWLWSLNNSTAVHFAIGLQSSPPFFFLFSPLCESYYCSPHAALQYLLVLESPKRHHPVLRSASPGMRVRKYRR